MKKLRSDRIWHIARVTRTYKKVRLDLSGICKGSKIVASFYMVAKANIYLKLGADLYRKKDAFGQPDSASDQRLLDTITLGMQQLVAGRGFLPELPLEDVGIEGFYKLMATLHFFVIGQKASREGIGFLDHMEVAHMVDGRNAVLFNRV